VKRSWRDVTSDLWLKLSTNFPCLPREAGKGRALEIDPRTVEGSCLRMRKTKYQMNTSRRKYYIKTEKNELWSVQGLPIHLHCDLNSVSWCQALFSLHARQALYSCWKSLPLCRPQCGTTTCFRPCFDAQRGFFLAASAAKCWKQDFSSASGIASLGILGSFLQAQYLQKEVCKFTSNDRSPGQSW